MAFKVVSRPDQVPATGESALVTAPEMRGGFRVVSRPQPPAPPEPGLGERVGAFLSGLAPDPAPLPEGVAPPIGAGSGPARHEEGKISAPAFTGAAPVEPGPDLTKSVAKAIPRGALDTAAVSIEPMALSRRVFKNKIATATAGIRRAADMEDAEFNQFLQGISQSDLSMPEKARLTQYAQYVRAGRLAPEDVPDITDTYGGNIAQDAMEGLRSLGETAFPIPAEDEERLAVQVGRGIGSSVPYIAARAIPGGQVVMPGFAMSAGQGEAIQRAAEAGLSDEEQARIGLLGAAPGLTDMAPIELLFRATPMQPGVKGAMLGIARKAVEQGLVEGTQEAVQGFMQNAIAKYNYAAEQGLTENLDRDALIGFLVGTVFGTGAGGIQAATGTRAEPVISSPQAGGVRDREEPAPGAPTEAETAVPPPASAAEPQASPPAPDVAPAAAPTPQPRPEEAPSFTRAFEEDALDRTVPPAEGQTFRVVERPEESAPAAPETLYDEDGNAIGQYDTATGRVIRAAEPTSPAPSETAGTRAEPVRIETPADVTAAADRTAEPTEAQKEAGNYQKRHVKWQGLDISIETEQGQARTGTDPDGKAWSVTMPVPYGYLKRTKGADGEQVDVYVGPEPKAPQVFVVDQTDADTKAFDEHKALIGFPDEVSARAAYEAAFSDGRGLERIGAIRAMPVAEFKAWLRNGDTAKPAAMPEPATPQLPEPDAAPQGPAPRLRGRKASLAKGPRDIFQFLAEQGGIRDETGELKGMDLHRVFLPGRGKLVRPGGMPLDRARELAEEAGYITARQANETASVDDLLQALSENAQGRKVFATEDMNEVQDREAEKRAAEEEDRYGEAAKEADAVARENGIVLTDAARAEAAMAIASGKDAEDAVFEAVEREAIESEAQEADTADSQALKDEWNVPFDTGRETRAGGTASRQSEATAQNDAEAEAEPASRREQPSRDQPGRGEEEGVSRRTASWVIRNKETGDVVMETFDRKKVDALNTEKYEAVPIQKYLAGLNARGTPAAPSTERTDAGEQTVIPGAERISDKALAERRMEQPRRATREQKPADEGLFDTGARGQGEMFSLAETSPEVSARTPFTGAFLEKAEQLYPRLRSELDRLGLKDIGLKLADTIEAFVNGEPLTVQGMYWRDTITLALDARDDPARTLRHESLHALRKADVFTEAEWATLSKEAQKWRADYDIDRNYAGFPEDAKIEEAIAHAWSDWNTGAANIRSNPVKRLFARIRNVLKAIGNAFRGLGFQTADDVFSRVESGEVGSRQRETGVAEPRFSIAPPTESEAFKKWFGDSKVVDENGKPLVVYHSTDKRFQKFDPKKAIGGQHWFTNDREAIERGEVGAAGRGVVVEAYLSLKNPAGWSEYDKFTLDELISRGYDGLLLPEKDGTATYVAFEPTQIKSVDNRGTFDPNDPRIRFSIADRPDNPIGKDAFAPNRDVIDYLAETTLPLSERLRNSFTPETIRETVDRWRTAFQDRFLPLLRAQQAIERQLGRKLGEIENPYLGEELSAGRKGAKLEDLSENMVRPLFEDMHKRGVSIDEIEAYLYARHAPERNARIAEINPAFRGDMIEEEGAGSGMTNEDAEAIMKAVDRAGKKADMEALAARVDEMTKFSLDERVKAGLMTKAEADAWRARYKHYVPLRGRAEVEEEGVIPDRPRQARGITVTGKESRMAFGRRSPARDILAYTIMQAEEAIVRAETNRVAQRFYNLAKAAPDSKFWKIDKVETRPTWVKARQEVAYRPVKQVTPEDRDFTVSLKIDGVEHRVTLNRDNAKAVRLAEAMRNLNGDQLGIVTQALGQVNRYLSQINTTLNPEFVITNAFRDLQTAAINLNQFDVNRIVTRTVKDYRKALAGSLKGSFGKADTEWSKYYHEFRRSGGRVYFNQVEDIAKLRSRIERDFRSAKPGLSSRKAITGLFDFIEKVNLGVENAVRLSAYKNLRESGLTQAQAASIAKNLTVNFNRRGSYGPVMNSLYLFYNASVQGTAVLLSATKSKRVRRVLYTIIATGIALDILNVMASGDDDDGELYYDKISDFDKSRNLIVMIPGGKGEHIKIPLPYGYNAFFAMGRSASELARGKEFTDVASALATTIVDSFNPIGGSESLLNFLSPTIADPVVDLSRNRDYADRPIMPEQDQYGPKVPDSQRYWNSVSPYFRAITDTLNEITGGTDIEPGTIDVSPEVLEHMFGFVTGAAGTFFQRNVDLVAKIADPASDVAWNDIPLARKVYGGAPLWYDKAMFYQRADEIEQVYSYAKGYAEQGREREADRVFAKYGPVIRLRAVAARTRKALANFRKARALYRKEYDVGNIDRATYTSHLKDIDQSEKRIITNFNRLYLEQVRGDVPNETGGPRKINDVLGAIESNDPNKIAAALDAAPDVDVVEALRDANRPALARIVRKSGDMRPEVAAVLRSELSSEMTA
ncbi:MAG: hypothetical protein KF895_02890 [Parvibaculum sp.]|nr:hypothetical protein [Parvibaculum sp.]